MAARAYSSTTKWRLAGLVLMLVVTIWAIAVLSSITPPRAGESTALMQQLEAEIAELERQIDSGELRHVDRLQLEIERLAEQSQLLRDDSRHSAVVEQISMRLDRLQERLALREATVTAALNEANAALEFDPYSATLPLETLSDCLSEVGGRDAVLDAAVSLVMQAQRTPADEAVEFDGFVLPEASTEWETFELERMRSILESRHLAMQQDEETDVDLSETFSAVADSLDGLRYDEAEATIEAAQAEWPNSPRLRSLQRIVQMCRHLEYVRAAEALNSLQQGANTSEAPLLESIAATIQHLRELDESEQQLIDFAQRHANWQPVLETLRELTAPQLADFSRPFDFERRPGGGPQWRYARYSISPSDESPDFAPLPPISGETIVVDLTSESEQGGDGIPADDPPQLEDEVTIVCILGRDSQFVGSYESFAGGGGGSAYRTDADLAFVDWKNRQVLGVCQLYNDPPSSIIVWEGQVSGGYLVPISLEDVDYWVRSVKERRGRRFESPIDLPGNPLASESPVTATQLEADADGDGRISQSEWVAAHGRSGIREFEALDGDGDGFVVEGEFSPAPDAALDDAMNLRSAENRNLVEVEARGNGLTSVLVTITSNSDEPLLVSIPAGLLFVSDNPLAQDMVATRSTILQFEAEDQEQTVDVQVACAAMHRDTPDEFTTFTLDERENDDLEDLLALEAFRQQSWRVRQFAVWTITNNPDRYGYVGLSQDGVEGLASGPTDEEIAAIRDLFDQAGIRLRSYPALAD